MCTYINIERFVYSFEDITARWKKRVEDDAMIGNGGT